MVNDWLDEADAWLGEEETEEEDPIPAEELRLVPTALSAMPVPADAKERNAKVTEAWDSLRPMQQVFLNTLAQNDFNFPQTVRQLSKTLHKVHRQTAGRWGRTDENYRFVLKVMQGLRVDEIIEPSKLLLRADEIASKALEPVPILHQGRPTGFYEHKLDTALRANEQLMKTQKMLGNDEGRITAMQGPAFIIQVVQGDGSLKDVTPDGIVIDLPGPDGS